MKKKEDTHEDRCSVLLKGKKAGVLVPGGSPVIKTLVVRNGRQSTLGYQPDVWKKWE